MTRGEHVDKLQFIEWLKALPGTDKAQMLAWDPDEANWLPVTGAVYDEKEIKLYTDDC
jgi:hypothetical protein